MRAWILVVGNLFLLSSFAAAGSLDRFSECGRYRVVGELAMPEKGQLVLKVFTGSMSETRLELVPRKASPQALQASAVLPGFVGRTVSVTGWILSEPKYRQGRLEFEAVSPAVPDALDPARGEGLFFLEKAPCEIDASGGKKK